MGSHHAPFSANLFFNEPKKFKSIKNVNYLVARKISNIFRFIHNLITKSDGNEFENHSTKIFLPGVILERENISDKENTFS